MTVRVSVIVAGLLAISAGAARAQGPVTVPLADVARQAEAAKATVKKAKKTYTNANLSADRRGETAAAAAPAVAPPVAAVASTPGTPGPATAAASAGDVKAEGESQKEKESEESWRARAETVRMQVDRLRTRMADLTTPNKLRDENPGAKANNDKEIANTRTALDGLRKQWARLEASVMERKVPIAWIQPQPVFPE